MNYSIKVQNCFHIASQNFPGGHAPDFLIVAVDAVGSNQCVPPTEVTEPYHFLFYSDSPARSQATVMDKMEAIIISYLLPKY